LAQGYGGRGAGNGQQSPKRAIEGGEERRELGTVKREGRSGEKRMKKEWWKKRKKKKMKEASRKSVLAE
jgi:hypothetical protein